MAQEGTIDLRTVWEEYSDSLVKQTLEQSEMYNILYNAFDFMKLDIGSFIINIPGQPEGLDLGTQLQTRFAQAVVDQTKLFEDEKLFPDKVKEDEAQLLKSLFKKMQDGLAQEVMAKVMEEQLSELGWTEVLLPEGEKPFPTSDSPVGHKRRGGAYGTFFEKMFLTDVGEVGSSPFSDFYKLHMDAKSSAYDRTNISVGSITIRSQSTTQLSDKASEMLGRIAALEKMFMKMRNLLFASFEERLDPSVVSKTRLSMRISAIDVYTTLMLLKLMDILNGMTYKVDEVNIGNPNTPSWADTSKLIGISRTVTKVSDGTYNYSYQLAINFEKGNMAKKLLELYKHRYELLSEIKSNKTYRAAFFGWMKDKSHDTFYIPPEQITGAKDYK